MITLCIEKDDYGLQYYCYDSAYDGAPDSYCALGSGSTPREALDSYLDSSNEKSAEWGDE
jgi:hypothetical protein